MCEGPSDSKSCVQQMKTEKNIIETAMSSTIHGSPPFTVCKKLQKCRKLLSDWNKNVFGNASVRLKETQWKLDEIQDRMQARNQTEEILRAEKQLLHELETTILQEEMHWCQNSRINYLKVGDQNTIFFT